MESSVEKLLESEGLLGNSAFVIRVPKAGELMTMNQRKHWSWVSKQKRAWRDATCTVAMGTPGLVFPNAGFRSIVRCVLPVTQLRRRDPHNYYPTVKPIVDGLVDAGVWPDDTPDFVETREPMFAICDSAYIVIHKKDGTIS